MQHRHAFVRVVPALLTALLMAACGGGDNPAEPEPDDDGDENPPAATTGSIQALVTADGAPRAGVTVRLVAAATGQTQGTQSTGTTGSALFGNLPVASYDVQVTPPTGFELATGETASKRLTVTAGVQRSVSFALATAGGGTLRVITIQGLSFSPADVTIAVGTTVRWENPTDMLHTVTPQGHNQWQSATLSAPGTSFSHTFNTPGEYAYFCQPHQSSGMTGIIRVQ